MSTAAVILENVTKAFPTQAGDVPVLAVDNINLQIENGEFFSMLGPSGCGKTTTLRMIAGFEDATSGRILIEGQDVSKIPPFHRPVNTVFQDYALFPHMTVSQNVGFGLEMERAPKMVISERVRDMLTLVQLPNMDKRYPRQLSGGQQQRVALARALVKEPRVLLLDEPLGALDLKLRKQMQLELKHMQRRLGITFIYVTHDQEEALTMSDRIAVMNRGHVLQVGTPAEIYDRPINRFVADFIGETNFIEGCIAEINAEKAVVIVNERWPLQVTTNGINNVKPGDNITVAVRPEKIEVHKSADGTRGENCVEGWLEEQIFVGTDTRYIVRLENGSEIVARVQNGLSGHAEIFTPGSNVKVYCSPQHTLLLRE